MYYLTNAFLLLRIITENFLKFSEKNCMTFFFFSTSLDPDAYQLDPDPDENLCGSETVLITC